MGSLGPRTATPEAAAQQVLTHCLPNNHQNGSTAVFVDIGSNDCRLVERAVVSGKAAAAIGIDLDMEACAAARSRLQYESRVDIVCGDAMSCIRLGLASSVYVYLLPQSALILI